MKRIMMFTAVLTAVILLGACEDLFGNKEPPPVVVTDEVDFGSYHSTSYSILVRNNTSQRLVAFKGDLHPDMLIGGIPARAQDHGLQRDPALFNKPESFPLILLTEAQYNSNKDDLKALQNTPFTRVFVFYNHTGDNTAVYEISDRVGGNNTLNIVNFSNTVNVELRLGGVAGEILGFAPAGIMNTSLRLMDGDYDIFPVFKRYNQMRDIVEEIYPKGTGTDYSWYWSGGFNGGSSATMNLSSLLTGLTFFSGASWVTIDNQVTGSGGIRFYEGSQTYTTATGNSIIMTSTTFQIEMDRLPGTSHYGSSRVVNNWNFGSPTNNVPLQTSADDTTAHGPLTIEQNKWYTVTITGDANTQGSMKAWISKIEDIPSDL